MSKIIAISTEHAPSPLGHYRQAIRAGGFIHVSGQLPIVTAADAPSGQAAPFGAQARLVLKNFLAIIAAAGARPADVVRVTAYVVGSANWPVFNQAFAEAFGDHRPVRSVVPVPELHHGYQIEIDGLALDTART